MTIPKNIKIKGINHIGIVAKDPSKAAQFFTSIGLADLGREIVPEQKVETHMFAPAPESGRLELLIPDGSGTGPIDQYIQKRGHGIHHIALSVENLEHAMSTLRDQGVQLVNQSPRNGAHNTKICFVHPHSTGGILVELVEQLD